MNRLTWLLLLALITAVAPNFCCGAEIGDIAFSRKSDAPGDYPPATFPHWVHRMQFRCHVCHEDIFQMQAGTNQISMEAIQQGKFCGACHNGKVAFAVMFDACQRCHRP
jgi:c(7)-type cytochrome triheme protein